MSKATAKNEIQVELQNYIVKMAETVYRVMQTETEHMHNNKKFFVHEDETGALVLTMESIVRERVEKILSQKFEENEVLECLEQLMVGSSTKTEMIAGIETIPVEGSDSQIYSKLLEYTPNRNHERRFLRKLNKAIEAGVEPFNVPVCDPSIDENGNLQFVAGCKPAVGYSYNEIKELARRNSVQLGSRNQHILFLATVIYRLMEEGWSEEGALYAVCFDSIKLGHYRDSTDAKGRLETTGSRKIAGKCDLANTYKILAKDEEFSGFCVAGGSYHRKGWRN